MRVFPSQDPAQEKSPPNKAALAFTRIELVVVVAAMALMAAVVLPAIANDRLRADRAVCANNLSRIGKALTEWAGDFGERYPSEVNYLSGGTRDHSDAGKTFLHFGALSNQLVTPAVVVCPSDGSKVKARAFDSFFRDPNVSYFLGHPLLTDGRSILAGDRNLKNPPATVSCPNFQAAYSLRLPATNAGWTALIHVNRGQVLFNDGSVEGADDGALRRTLSRADDTNAVFHYLTPSSF